jgi:hypothetical protein
LCSATRAAGNSYDAQKFQDPIKNTLVIPNRAESPVGTCILAKGFLQRLT